MAWFEFIWTDIARDKIAQHGISQDQFEYAFTEFWSEGTSRTSGRPLRVGPTSDGRLITMIFEWLENGITVEPITAFETDER